MSRAIGCRNVSERSMSQMDSKLGYGVRGCGGEVEGWRREARAFVNELASGPTGPLFAPAAKRIGSLVRTK